MPKAWPDEWNIELRREVVDIRSISWENKLYELLIDPIDAQLQDLGVRHLVVMPDLGLSLVPFQCLQDDDGTRLSERYTISYAPSFPSLVDTLTRLQNTSVPESILFVQDPTDSLTFAKWERDMVTKCFSSGKVRVLDSSTADKESIASAAPHYDVIHFCTHGRFDSESPKKSGVALKGGEWLSLQEIERLTFKDGALVFLSACETARLKLHSRSASAGMSPSFLSAGAATVVSSFWAVNDLSTALFAARFYENLIRMRRSRLESITEAASWIRHIDTDWVETITRSLTIGVWASTMPPEQAAPTKKRATFPFNDYYFWGAFGLYGSWV
jgi:CHAT domain-containing protein